MARRVDQADPPSNRTSAVAESRGLRYALLGALLFQIVLLLGAGARNQHLLNTDGVAYLRLAGYYAAGQTELMISGYWGPLLSWLIAPLLKLGVAPLVSARWVMGISAVVFWLGSVALFRSVKLPALAQVLGAWLITLQSVYWSVEYISPDLLVGGLMALALSQMLAPRWIEHRPKQIMAGIGWAFAFFAKAVAFPLAIGICLLMAVLKGALRQARTTQVCRSVAVTLLTFAVLAAPWVAVISFKYQTPTFSTSGRINHAIVGPKDVERYHPFVRQFHPPEPGRVTAWEDPTRMAYHYWSPFANRAYFEHQIQLVQDNFATVLALLFFVNYDWLGLSILIVSGLILCRAQWREPGRREVGWGLFLALACSAAIYLPVYVKIVDQRYFYFAYVLLLSLALSATAGLVERWHDRFSLPRGLALTGIFILLAALPLLRVRVAIEGLDNPASLRARQLADKMQAAGLRGPIAGSGLVAGGRAALYVAYFLNLPWHGDELHPTATSYRTARARFIIVNRQHAVAGELNQDPAFRNLDPRLFPSPKEADEFPLQVFEMIPP